VRLNEDGSGGLSAAQAVSVSSRSALYDAPFQLLDGRAGLVVWIGDADPKPWWRALRRYRAEPGLGRSSWRPREWLTFLRVAWGEADRAETLNWLEERVPHERVRLQPAARSLDWPRAVRQVRSADGWWRWALTFYHRIRLATRWSDVVKAVEEALAQLGCQPTPQMARILSTWNDWDGLKPPTPDLVRRLLTLWGGETPEDDTPVSLDLAHWSDQPLSAPEGLLVVVDDGRGRMPGRAERYPLLSGAVRAPRWEKLWLQQLFDTASYAWLVYQEPARWPPRIRRTAAQAFEQAPPASIAAVEWPWHQAWRVDPGHNAWTGRVSPALVGAVLPTDWTATGIERFGRCPLHFFWSEVLAVRPAPGDQPRTVPNDLIGRWAHRVLETMAMTDELTPDSRPAIRQAIDQAVAEASPPPSVMAWHVQAVCQQLAYEIDEVVFRYREALHEAVTGEPERTVQWTVTLDDTTVWPFRGRLDRLDRLPDGSLRIVDYKTGRAVPDPARYAPWSLQLPLYQQAVAEQSGRAVTAEVWGISWRSGFVRRILSAEVAERQRSKLVRLLKGIHARVAQGQFYPLPKPGLNPCRTCEYRPLCPNAIGLWAEKKLRGESLFRALWEDDSEDLGSSGPTQGAGAGD
jgi:RecB family exonuclease